MNRQELLSKSSNVLVMAHRGGGGLAPENTMVAFQNAVDMKVDVLEMDIHSTADNVLVISHDPTVDRLTNGRGEIRDYTFAELKKLDAGYHWTSNGGKSFPFRDKGISIPTLEEVLSSFRHAPVNVDLKQRNPSIVKPFAKLIRDFKMTDKVLAGSFDNDTTKQLREELSEAIKICSMNEVRLFYLLHRLRLSRFFRGEAEAFQLPGYHGSLQVITPRLIHDLHKQGLHLHIWTVNEKQDMERLIDWGVNGIITDYPDRLLQVLGQKPNER